MTAFLRRIRADIAIVVLAVVLALTHPDFVLDFLRLVFGWR